MGSGESSGCVPALWGKSSREQQRGVDEDWKEGVG